MGKFCRRIVLTHTRKNPNRDAGTRKQMSMSSELHDQQRLEVDLDNQGSPFTVPKNQKSALDGI